MKRIKYLLLLVLPITTLLSGCLNTQASAGGGLDLIKLTKNPIVMVIIGGIVLWYVFSHSGKH